MNLNGYFALNSFRAGSVKSVLHFLTTVLIFHIFQWRVRRLQIQDKSRTPWHPGQDPEIKDCSGKSRTDDHLRTNTKGYNGVGKTTLKKAKNTHIRAYSKQLWRHCCRSRNRTQFPSHRCGRPPADLLVRHWFHRQVELLLNKHITNKRHSCQHLREKLALVEVREKLFAKNQVQSKPMKQSDCLCIQPASFQRFKEFWILNVFFQRRYLSICPFSDFPFVPER